ncbi:hypothetical protein JQ609_28655 [Bradyrhizobium sp. AUGA SZCCT0169]|uniref:hypothetical protein n=1 Tax=Bradyrhizobium sp. AUGA SZCCT0169 TaxID=2807663 RepID=UPI001BA52982|nr:hypothetical protein [Bradyrhizobium sp. AUGA SZCCT0169]MBR1250880.1 hypothetical protein [Bradyrhizobium sp. AUGA SZCCT0169]
MTDKGAKNASQTAYEGSLPFARSNLSSSANWNGLGSIHGQNDRTSDCANLRLPDANQEKIGRRLLSRMERLNSLRGEIDKGISSLDAGKGGDLNVEDFLREKNSRNGGA